MMGSKNITLSPEDIHRAFDCMSMDLIVMDAVNGIEGTSHYKMEIVAKVFAVTLIRMCDQETQKKEDVLKILIDIMQNEFADAWDILQIHAHKTPTELAEMMGTDVQSVMTAFAKCVNEMGKSSKEPKEGPMENNNDAPSHSLN